MVPYLSTRNGGAVCVHTIIWTRRSIDSISLTYSLPDGDLNPILHRVGHQKSHKTALVMYTLQFHVFMAATSTSQKFCGAAFSFLKDDPGLPSSTPGVANLRIYAREVAHNMNCNVCITDACISAWPRLKQNMPGFLTMRGWHSGVPTMGLRHGTLGPARPRAIGGERVWKFGVDARAVKMGSSRRARMPPSAITGSLSCSGDLPDPIKDPEKRSADTDLRMPFWSMV
jgi:hypothetical protein